MPLRTGQGIHQAYAYPDAQSSMCWSCLSQSAQRQLNAERWHPTLQRLCCAIGASQALLQVRSRRFPLETLSARQALQVRALPMLNSLFHPHQHLWLLCCTSLPAVLRTSLTLGSTAGCCGPLDRLHLGCKLTGYRWTQSLEHRHSAYDMHSALLVQMVYQL